MLEAKYRQSKTPKFRSIPQASGVNFQLKTKQGAKFLAQLHSVRNVEKLKPRFPELNIHKNNMIVKTFGYNYMNEDVMTVHCIDRNGEFGRGVQLKYTDSLTYDSQRIFIEPDLNGGGTSYLNGTLTNEKFKTYRIPERYSDWINYANIMLESDDPVFTHANKLQPLYPTKLNPLQVLQSYFYRKTFPPKVNDEMFELNKRHGKWLEQRNTLVDSLFESDIAFRKIFKKAITYAEKSKTTNDELVDFAEHFNGKQNALELIRFKPKSDACGLSKSVIYQERKIVDLALATRNWPAFIKASIDIINVKLNAKAMVFYMPEETKTYGSRIENLDINLDKILVGSLFTTDEKNNKLYQITPQKIGQFFASRDAAHQDFYESSVASVIEDPDVDLFNKLQFYNSFMSYKKFFTNSERIAEIEMNLIKFKAVLAE